MKTIKLIFITFIIAAMLLPESMEAQSWGGRGKPSFWNNWSINANVGLTSFYGDLSVYDGEILNKLSQESGPSMGFILSKYFNDKLGVSGQFLLGNLKGEDARGTAFESSFYEYNFHVRLELINTIFPDNFTDFGMYLYGGLGQFIFQTTKWERIEGEEVESVKDTGTPEFVYFVGTSMEYKFNNKIGASLDLALRQAKNDYLDYEVKNGNNDYYTHISIGVTYYIESFKQKMLNGRGKYTRGKMSGNLPMRRRR